MGECGCAGFTPDKTFKINDNLFLSAGYYTGCNYCDTPLGVDLWLFDKTVENDIVQDTDKIEALELNWGSFNIPMPMVGREELKNAVAKIKEDGFDYKDYDSLEDVIEDYGLRLLQYALAEGFTIRKENK